MANLIRRLRFSLRTLLLFVGAISVVLGVMGARIVNCKRERAIITSLLGSRDHVAFEHQMHRAKPSAMQRFWSILSDDPAIMSDAHAVHLTGPLDDRRRAALRQLVTLREVRICEKVAVDDIAAIATLPHLRKIAFVDCELDGTLTDSIKRCTQLETVLFARGRVDSSVMAATLLLPKLRHFQAVDCSNERLTLPLFTAPKLSYLGLAGLAIDENSFHGIEHARELVELDLALRNWNVDIARAVGTSPSLKMLRVLGAEVGDEWVRDWIRTLDLRELSVKDTGISDEIVCSMLELKNLKILNLANTSVSDRSLPCLQKLTHLAGLRLDGSRLTDNAIRQLKQKLPKCYIQ